MNKKVEKNEANKFLLVVLSLLFCFTLYITLNYVGKYYYNQKPKDNEEIIEVKTEKISASIINSGTIKQTISEDSFGDKKEIIIETIDSIEVLSNEDKENIFNYNVRYDITKNDFHANTILSNRSEVLVRFSYSYDNKEWIYINNAITTNTSNITPLIGNNYDIAGLITKLNVATNFEIKANNKNATKMYWRSETIFKNLDNLEDAKELNANFTIEYKTSD